MEGSDSNTPNSFTQIPTRHAIYEGCPQPKNPSVFDKHKEGLCPPNPPTFKIIGGQVQPKNRKVNWDHVVHSRLFHFNGWKGEKKSALKPEPATTICLHLWECRDALKSQHDILQLSPPYPLVISHSYRKSLFPLFRLGHGFHAM